MPSRPIPWKSDEPIAATGTRARKRLELPLEVVVHVNHRMADFSAVQPHHDLIVDRSPCLLKRVRSDRDATLAVDVIDLVRGAQPPVHGALDADGDDVLGRTVDLFAGQHGRAAGDAREPASDLAVEHLIVAGDGDGIEPLPPRLQHQTPRRDAVAAPGRTVDVKVSGQNAKAVNAPAPAPAPADRWRCRRRSPAPRGRPRSGDASSRAEPPRDGGLENRPGGPAFEVGDERRPADQPVREHRDRPPHAVGVPPCRERNGSRR